VFRNGTLHRNRQRAFYRLRLLTRTAPNIPLVNLWLARVSFQVGAFHIASEALEHILVNRTRNHYWSTWISALQTSFGDVKGSFETLRWAHERFPRSWAVCKSLAELHSSLGQREEAMACYRRMLEIAPSKHVHVCALLGMAECQESFGSRDDAIALYQQVAGMVPPESLQSSQAYLRLVYCQPWLDSTDQISQILSTTLQCPLLGAKQKQYLNYALGHLYDRSARPREAFKHF
jgi:tetratricopeptide (TPR) repeat protein